MSTHAAGYAGAPALTRRSVNRRAWERCAPWVAPLLTAGLLALCTFVMFASQGAAVI
jgi:hypothetical protein